MQAIIASAVGGENVGDTVEGLQRFPINVRYPREIRDWRRPRERRRWMGRIGFGERRSAT